MAKMDWRRARLHGRPSIDFRREAETPDRADRWLSAVERVSVSGAPPQWRHRQQGFRNHRGEARVRSNFSVCVISGRLPSSRRRIALGTLDWPGTFLPADMQRRWPYL